MFTPMLLATTVLVIYYALDISLLKGLKRGSRAADTPSRVGRVTQRDSNSNPISPVPTGPEEEEAEEEEEEEEVVETEAATSLDHCQSESYHWCEEDDLTSSEAATSTDKTIGSSGCDPDPHSAEEYAEMAKKVDLNLAHIDMENFKSADLFQSEQIRSLLIEYNRPILCSQSQLSQDDCSLTDCGSLCKSGPLFSPQRAVPGVCGVGGGKGISPSDCSIDSLNMAERDECWLLEEAGDGASQLLCRTNMTNYTLAWSSSASGTDQDLDYNEPGTSSSGSEQSHWSSSGSGGRVAPPIPPWPITSRQQQFTGLRNDPTPRKLQCWAPQPQSSNKQPTPTKPNMKKSTTEQLQKSHKEDAQQQEIRTTAELTNFQSIGKSEDSPSLSDMDNGNGKATPKDNRTRQRPVFTKTESKATTPPSSAGLSLLQIYMRQRSQTSMERESNKKSDDVIASGGGEGWVEDYPSSADEKLGLESISSSLADEDEDDDSEDDDDSEEDDEDDLCQNNRSLTLTDVSDIEQTSIQIDAVPFNTTAATSSLDKLIAKIKPFELGLSPASIEEHWNFESRMRLAAPIPAPEAASTLVDKGCQVAINPATSATQEESTLTDPIKPQAYLIFPSYSLPDLSFLKKHDYTWIGDVLLSPQNLPASSRKPEPIARQHTQQSFDDLKRRQMGHVKDWESLKILLPEEIRQQINNIKPSPVNRNSRPRPKSCEQTVILRNAKKTSPRPATCRGSVAWPDATAGYMLPTVPQSPPGGADGGPPPLPKRTASLPHSPAAVRQRRNVALSTESVKSAVSKRAANTSPTGPASKPAFGYTMRKTVSFGEHLSGGFLKMSSQRRPLSLSHWSGGGSLDMNSPGEEDVAVNLEQKQELVKAVSVACAQLCKIMNQPINISDEDSCANHSKSVARCLTSQLSPAIYQLLSDGLLPNVNTFFGQVNNSVWRVVEASVKKGPGLPWIEELVFCLNSEESLPEGPVRFGVFITELVNMGGLDWWLDNLSAKETILRRHYAPHGFLYLCHTSTRPLMDELQSYLRPLAALPFDNTLPLPPPKKLVVTSPGNNKQTSAGVTSPASKPSTPTKTILKSPTRSKTQRPMSYVQNSPSKMSPKPLYRRTQSQHSGLSPKKSNNVAQQQQQQAESSKTETKVEEFSSLKQKWESLCGDRKKAGETATSSGGNKSNIAPVIPAPVTAPTGETSPLKSRIPRPVFRFSK